jgi:hypothetical protein
MDEVDVHTRTTRGIFTTFGRRILFINHSECMDNEESGTLQRPLLQNDFSIGHESTSHHQDVD